MKLFLIRSMKYLVVPIALAGLTACGSNKVIVKEPVSELVSDKDKGYVMFVIPSFFGHSYGVDIMEFDHKTSMPTENAIVLDKEEKVVFPMNEGEHYFYTNFGANEHVIKIDVKKGDLHHVNMGFPFIPRISYLSRAELANKIKQLGCNKSNLSRYLFSDITEIQDDSILTSNSSSPQTLKYSSPLLYEVTCLNNNVVTVQDTYYGVTAEDLEEAKLVRASKEQEEEFKLERTEYQEDIKKIAPLYLKKFDQADIGSVWIGLTGGVLPIVERDASSNKLNRYGQIQIDVSMLGDYVDQEEYKAFKVKASELEAKITGDGKNLKVKLEVYKLDTGSMAGRYFTLGFSASSAVKSMGVTGVYVSYFDAETNELIGKVRLSTVLTGGVLGGINTMTSDILDFFTKYTEATFIAHAN
jgi:hypothetical protein